MLTTSPTTRDASLVDLIQKAIRLQVDTVIGEEITKLQATVERRVRESVGQIAARVLSQFSMQTYGTTLRVEVDFKGTGKKLPLGGGEDYTSDGVPRKPWHGPDDIDAP